LTYNLKRAILKETIRKEVSMKREPKYMQRVEHWDFDEPENPGGIITLHYGWSFEPNCHEGVCGFDTKKEARAAVKGAYKCNCQECRERKA
jgi:hypothetical protein